MKNGEMCNKNSVGLFCGILMGAFHLFWAILIAVGVAQSLMDWIFNLHMIDPVWNIQTFSIVTSLELVVFTFIVGYVGGWLATALWNWSKSRN
jgi:hypothetical protein